MANRHVRHTGGVVVQLDKEIIVDDIETGVVVPKDKRSGLVDRHRALRQVLCYVCCAEFGTKSLKIHYKTCIKKHAWGLDLVEHEEGVPKKKAAMNRKKCVEPGSGPDLPIPTSKSSNNEFDEFNAKALELFTEHAGNCLWCRERNQDAVENMRFAREQALLKEHLSKPTPDDHSKEAEEVERTLEENERHLMSEEEELIHQLLEILRRRKHDTLLEEALARQKLGGIPEELEDEEAKLIRELREEEAARRKAAEEEALRRKKEKAGHFKYLKKHDGVLASSQGAAVYRDSVNDRIAMENIASMSLSHAQKEKLIVGHHQIGGDTFHASHTAVITKPGENNLKKASTDDVVGSTQEETVAEKGSADDVVESTQEETVAEERSANDVVGSTQEETVAEKGNIDMASDNV